MLLVLVAGATIECMHAGAPFGKAAISGGDGRLAVSGNGALTAGMEVGISFEAGKPGVLKACTYQNPSGAKQACTATFAAITGISAMLSVGGSGRVPADFCRPAPTVILMPLTEMTR